MILFLGTIIVFFCISCFIVFFYSRPKTLSVKDKGYFSKQLKKIASQEISEREKIISYDTLFHKILQALGYQGSFGEILKKHGKYIQQSEEIWKLHRLRNKLVHELFEIDEKEGEKQRRRYEIIIKNYL